MTDCGKVNKVEVDNTPEECGGNFTDYKCVIVTDSLPYIGNKPNIRLSELLQSIEEAMKEQDRIISWLTREVKRLKHKIK